MGDITVNLYHDGVFVPNPLKYMQGECQVINDVRFEEMPIGEVFEVVRRLVLNPPKRLYYRIPGTTLTRGIRELKTDDDVNDFTNVAFKNGFKIDLYTEIVDYDVMEFVRNDNLHTDNVKEGDYVSDELDDEDVEVANVDFHTQGEENVVFERLTVNDPFLNKLVGKGNFIGTKDDPIPPLGGKYFVEEADPDDDMIDERYKVKKGVKYPSYNPETPWEENKPILGMKFENPQQLKHLLADYGVKHGYQLWYYRSDSNSLLVYCGRDLELGRCAGRRDRVRKSKKKAKDKEGNGQEENDKATDKMPVTRKSPRKVVVNVKPKVKWTRMKVGAHKGKHCPFRLWASWMSSERSFQIKTLYSDHRCARNFNMGSLVTFRWIARHYAKEIIMNPSMTYQAMRETKMKQIKEMDETAYDYLMERDPATWCKAFFRPDSQCASFENGISESFNGQILPARGKPIIAMLEDIRVYIMQRMWNMSKQAAKCDDSITPSIRKQLEQLALKQMKWQVIPSTYMNKFVYTTSKNKTSGISINEVGETSKKGGGSAQEGGGSAVRGESQNRGGGSHSRGGGSHSRGGGSVSRGGGSQNRGGGGKGSKNRGGGSKNNNVGSKEDGREHTINTEELEYQKDVQAEKEVLEEEARKRAEYEQNGRIYLDWDDMHSDPFSENELDRPATLSELEALDEAIDEYNATLPSIDEGQPSQPEPTPPHLVQAPTEESQAPRMALARLMKGHSVSELC
ncbi:hypothetical protein CTI12_AA045570 [Artemisia annua]|uniref:PB1-like domain-containing protein n=1 Tax=Artemisia annua TaxID=35608 RepID=A0A2U1QD32_ARTAN|nr:hypothetical protein CTI12_AA045570 [Artemisia annua]